MKCIILAAGKGSRMKNTTKDTPKPLLEINGKSIIQHVIENLPREIDEVLVVVSYLEDKIKAYLGDSFDNKRIIYVRQEKLLGTADAVEKCKKYVKDKLMVLMGDNIYNKEDLERCLAHENCILANQVSGKFTGGLIELDKNGNITSITEGEHERELGHLNAAAYVLSPEYFNYEMVPIKEGREFGLPQTIAEMAKDHPVKIETTTFWHQINTPEELEHAKEILG